MVKRKVNIKDMYRLFLITLKDNWPFKAKTIVMQYGFIAYVKTKCMTIIHKR